MGFIVTIKLKTLDNADLLISMQIGLFSKFLLLMSFLQVELASQKETRKSCIPTFVEKIACIRVERAKKFKLLTFRIFCFLIKGREPVREVIYRKEEGDHCAFKRVKYLSRYYNTHHRPYFFLSVCARCITWRDIAT